MSIAESFCKPIEEFKNILQYEILFVRKFAGKRLLQFWPN